MKTKTRSGNAILTFVESMQRILDGIQDALRKNDIAERNAMLEQLQKELGRMKIPLFRFY